MGALGSEAPAENIAEGKSLCGFPGQEVDQIVDRGERFLQGLEIELPEDEHTTWHRFRGNAAAGLKEFLEEEVVAPEGVKKSIHIVHIREAALGSTALLSISQH